MADVRRWLAPACSVVLLAWALTCLVPARALGQGSLGLLATPLVTLVTLTPFIAVASIALVTIAARHQLWVVAAVAAVAGLFPWFFVLGYASPSDAQPAPGAASVRLLLVNAHQGKASAADIVAAATSQKADVVVVTELSGGLAHDLTTAGLDAQVSAQFVQLPPTAADPVDAGIGVWSRYSMDGVQKVPGTQWPAVIGRVDVPGAPFLLIAGHVQPPLPDGGRRWAGDLAALQAVAAQAHRALPTTPQVLLGNLNATPWHADYRRFSGVGLVDAAEALGQGLRPTWPTWSPLPVLPLDHALVSPAVTVDSLDTVVVDGTDHRALSLAVRVPPHS